MASEIQRAAEPRAIIDFPAADGTRELLAFETPREILYAESLDQVRNVVCSAELQARAGFWVIGLVSYDAAPAFDAALRVRDSAGKFPLAWFAVFDGPSSPPDEKFSPDEPAFWNWHPGIGHERFHEDIGAIRRAIFDGDVYQVNHTLRLHGSYTGDSLHLFHRLRRTQPDSYAAYLNLGQWRVLSVSPELFFRRTGHVLTARPMKGTARRGRYPEEDRKFAEALQSSAKNRAENLMIVDLLRNDLSRIAVPHSVRVSEMLSVERHPTVLQMTSTVTAQAKPETTLDDIFAALFPCGSVTGAPKTKAMEIIAERETEPRNIYCGAIGLLRPDGDATFNVAIRTVTLDAENSGAACGLGSGIVWDSSAEDEYEEVLLKSRFLSEENGDFQLLETLRLENGRYPRLDHHMARLSASSRYFGRPFDMQLCRKKLDGLAAETGTPAARVRISVDASGAMDIHVTAAPLPVSGPATFAVSDVPVCHDSIWLFHKTTRRDMFERALAAHPEVFDVLLLNEQGELTEFTRGNLVLQVQGHMLTPAIDCGLLDGCLRRELLDQGKIVEARLTLADLAGAQRIWFINSLRGHIEMSRLARSEVPVFCNERESAY
jgi:para-aminobenzoate synthetase/4-amino-4-deoxychorismate lyase